MSMGKGTDPSLGRWISNEIVQRKLIELSSYLRVSGRFSFICIRDVYVIKLLPLMIFNEGLQCFLSNRWFVQLLRLGSFKCSSDFCHFVVNVGAPLWMSRRNLYRFFWYSVKISYDKRMSCKSASSWLCGFSSLMFQWRSMLSFYVFPYAVSHRFECHSALQTFSSLHLSQMVSGEYDSCRVIRLTIHLQPTRKRRWILLKRDVSLSR